MLKRHKDINPSMSVAELITTDQKLKKKKKLNKGIEKM